MGLCLTIGEICKVITHISRHHGATVGGITKRTAALVRGARVDAPRCDWATAACTADGPAGAAARLVWAGDAAEDDTAAAVRDWVGFDEVCGDGGADKT